VAITKSNRQSYYPTISPKPTPDEIALHLKNLYTSANNHDAAIELVNNKVGASTESTSSTSTTELVTKTIVSTQLPGLGGVQDRTGSTSYTPTALDSGALLLFGDASPVAVTLSSGMTTPYILFVTNSGPGVVTLTPSSGTINGAASWVLPQGGLFLVGFDGTNWKTSDVLTLAQTFAAITHEFLTAYDATTGMFTAARPDYADLTGTPTLPVTETPVAGKYLTGYDSTTGAFSVSATAGITDTITTAALTLSGTQGSMTFTDGVLTAQVPAT
jgi:hypothetical protein